VDLLNANEVDISLEPLDSYNDGEDMEEDDEEGEDGEDEYEEIEEEVFDLCEPKRKRTANYTKIKDTCLVRAWSQVTVDAVTGSYQTGKHYWQHIKDKFFKFMPRIASTVTCSYQSLQGQWDAVKASCSRCSGALEQVQNAPPSGATIDDYVIKLCILLIDHCEMHCDCMRCILLIVKCAL
jgi:hypothetical protein